MFLAHLIHQRFFRYQTTLLIPLLLSTTFLPGCGRPGSADGGETLPVMSREEPKRTDAAAAAGRTAPPPAASPHQVVIDNFAFQPAELTVSAGTKVTWINRDDVPHTATSTAKPRAFDSHALDTDEQFSYVFTTSGTYEYFCAVHPHMIGKVIVK